jgi:hypothetical protein
MRGRLVALGIAWLLALAGPADAQVRIEDLIKDWPQQQRSGRGLGEVRIGEGLKEALRVGTQNAVALTGRLDGYFANRAIKILMPERLRNLETGLRSIGLGAQVDELVLGMNRAAERAAPYARDIFFDAIGEMTIDDARRILGGPDTAATDYFRGKTTGPLTTAFTPVVERAMNEVGVSRQYNQILDQARAIPFFRTEDYDLNRYVVDKALAGLFHVVGEEERKIRRDPAARVTDILRDVFGQRQR